ncbi:hypothetical protein LINPERPRIM_LOCUS26635 [Linum perenne]
MVVDSSGNEEEEEEEEASGDVQLIGGSSAEREMEFIGTLLSWSLEDIFDEHLYQVSKIPMSFESAEQYFPPFVLPLLEETRAELESAMEVISSAPFAKVTGFEECKAYGTFLYDVQVCDWENRHGGPGNEHYKMLPGDIVLLADAKPETVSDLRRVGRMWSLAVVTAFSEDDGDILLFGDEDRPKTGSEAEEIYLDYRVKKLGECFGSVSGWQYGLSSAIHFLEHLVSQFFVQQENERLNLEYEKEPKGSTGMVLQEDKYKSFVEYAKNRFRSTVLPFRNCVVTLWTHVPESYMGTDIFEKFKCVIRLLDSFQRLLFCDSVYSTELEKLFTSLDLSTDSFQCFTVASIDLCICRNECLFALKDLGESLQKVNFPSIENKNAIQNFCFQTASLIFCTASSSYNLHSMDMKPLDLLVIDEAAQHIWK